MYSQLLRPHILLRAERRTERTITCRDASMQWTSDPVNKHSPFMESSHTTGITTLFVDSTAFSHIYPLLTILIPPHQLRSWISSHPLIGDLLFKKQQNQLWNPFNSLSTRYSESVEKGTKIILHLQNRRTGSLYLPLSLVLRTTNSGSHLSHCAVDRGRLQLQ